MDRLAEDYASDSDGGASDSISIGDESAEEARVDLLFASSDGTLAERMSTLRDRTRRCRAEAIQRRRQAVKLDAALTTPALRTGLSRRLRAAQHRKVATLRARATDIECEAKDALVQGTTCIQCTRFVLEINKAHVVSAQLEAYVTPMISGSSPRCLETGGFKDCEIRLTVDKEVRWIVFDGTALARVTAVSEPYPDVFAAIEGVRGLVRLHGALGAAADSHFALSRARGSLGASRRGISPARTRSQPGSTPRSTSPK
jgi:hypothetical protein